MTVPLRPPTVLAPLALLLAGLLAACDLPAKPQAAASAAAQTQQTPSGRSQAQNQPVVTRDPASGLRWVAAGDLPREGQATLQTIARGGPFRYSRDGVTFGNRERLLPQRQRGHYREYTVPTPGERDRGARRIVCGGQPATSTAECYYTADHYASFRRIRP